MSRFRYTIDELLTPESENHLSDYDLIRALINERISDINSQAPLYKRLKQLSNRVENCIDNKGTLENKNFNRKP